MTPQFELGYNRSMVSGQVLKLLILVASSAMAFWFFHMVRKDRNRSHFREDLWKEEESSFSKEKKSTPKQVSGPSFDDEKLWEGVRAEEKIAFQLLRLKPTATEKEIQKAFNREIKKVHPDRVENESEAIKKKAALWSQKLLEAREMLVAFQSKKNH